MVAVILYSSTIFIWITLAFMLLPMVAALLQDSQFPDIAFQEFSKFILNNFSSKITLAQALLFLFTITDSTDLITLHAHQQNPQYKEETCASNSGWIKCLA